MDGEHVQWVEVSVVLEKLCDFLNYRVLMIEPTSDYSAQTSLTDDFLQVFGLLGYFKPLIINVNLVILELNILIWHVLVIDEPLIELSSESLSDSQCFLSLAHF